MTSTTLDVTLCLLLVSAGAVTVATTSPADDEPRATDRADHVLQTAATTTATVAYGPDVAGDGRSRRRTRNGTLVALLADAAVRNLSVGGDPVRSGPDAFVTGVANASRSAVGATQVQIVASWRPYPGAPVEGRVAVGSTPPADVSVRAAATTVPSGLPSARRDAVAAARVDGYTGVANVMADRVVDGLFPPEATALALGRPGTRPARIRERYEEVADRTGADVAGPEPPTERAVRRANDRLAAALASRLEPDLRRSFETPTAAARATSVDGVTVVVRTWS